MNNSNSGISPYEQDLDKVTANHTQLSPLSYIERAASVYPNQLAVVHGERRLTWTETFTPLSPASHPRYKSAGSV